MSNIPQSVIPRKMTIVSMIQKLSHPEILAIVQTIRVNDMIVIGFNMTVKVPGYGYIR